MICVFYYMTGAPEGSPKVVLCGFMEKPGIEPATPGLQGIALIHYTTGASLCGFSIGSNQYWDVTKVVVCSSRDWRFRIINSCLIIYKQSILQTFKTLNMRNVLSSADVSKINILKKIFYEYDQSVKQFRSISGPTFVGPDLGPNCLQRLSAGKKLTSLCD